MIGKFVVVESPSCSETNSEIVNDPDVAKLCARTSTRRPSAKTSRIGRPPIDGVRPRADPLDGERARD